jgi:cytochrome c
MNSKGLGAAAIALSLLVAGPARAQDPGMIKFWSTCGACHELDATLAHSKGPNLWGLIGKTMGAIPRFATYSAAMKEAGTKNVVWTEELLDRWLANPQAVVPGNQMEFNVDAAADRAAVIGFLRTQR